MVSAESPSLVVADAGGPAHALNNSERRLSTSSGHLSEGSTSLARRSRVKRKNSRLAEDSSSIVSTSGEISSSQLFVQIPSTDSRAGSSPKSLGALETGAPPRPPRSPQRLQTAPAFGSSENNLDEQRLPRPRTRSTEPSASRPVIDDIRGREARSENGQRWKSQRLRGVSLPGHAFRNSSVSDSSEQPSPLTPNTFNDAPPAPIFAASRRFRHQPRDSGVTQQSTTSSSIYPKSTSTEGSYPSPPSLPAQDMDDRHIITVDPADDAHLDALHGMDADEVSYRLRLLMQNNYYLPPAHSKPFSEIPDVPRKSPAKSSSPTFFDIFKVVKKKTAVSCDNKIGSTSAAPILRTTSDSSTVTGLLRPQQPPVPPQRMRTVLSAPQIRQETKGRVVVVRERMEDLAIVAKQVEQDLRVREAERQRNAGDSSHSDRIEAQFVDPTDSVDLPMVPSSEFFGPQAALLRGMGVDSSLGAALLADQLPPSSPGSWSVESEDMAWRKALLHAAVDHSLNNSSVQTPARSVTSSSPNRALDPHSPTSASASPSMLSPPAASPVMCMPSLPSQSVEETNSSVIVGPSEFHQKPIIGQSILKCIIDKEDGGQNGELKKDGNSEPLTGQQSGAEAGKSRSLIVSTEPLRASSPTAPTMPLQPPPRRSNPTSSGSSSDHAQEQADQEDDGPLVTDAGPLQAEQDTTLRLSDVYESHVGLSGAFGNLTPSGSQHNSATLSAVKPGTADSSQSRTTEILSTTSGSHYSDDDGEFSTFHTPQEHTLASTVVGSRPSFGSLSVPRESCESSQPSPTTSAFRDAYDRGQYADSLADHSEINTLGGGNSRISSRASNFSDPSSTFVSPPPRVSSMRAYSSMSSHRSHQPSRLVTDISRPSNDAADQEEPGTPTALHVPRLTVQDLLAQGSNSSPFTASPISFFDAVEMQSHQDEDESSGSEDGNENEGEEDEDEEDEDEDEDGDNVSSVRDDASVASSSVGGCQSDSAGIMAIDPRISSTHSLAHDRRCGLGALLQHRNASSPQLSSRTAPNDRSLGMEYQTTERWRGISNIPQTPTHNTFWSKKHGKHHDVFPNPPRVSESTADWLKHEEAKTASAMAKRPQTATSGSDGQSLGGKQLQPKPSVRRLDGMLIEHMEREKEVLKRITTTLTKSPT